MRAGPRGRTGFRCLRPAGAHGEVLHRRGGSVNRVHPGDGADLTAPVVIERHRATIEVHRLRGEVHHRAQHPVEVERRADFLAHLENECQVVLRGRRIGLLGCSQSSRETLSEVAQHGGVGHIEWRDRITRGACDANRANLRLADDQGGHDDQTGRVGRVQDGRGPLGTSQGLMSLPMGQLAGEGLVNLRPE